MARRKANPASHANRGKAWEMLLEAHHAAMESRSLAVVFRTPPPMRILRPVRGGQFLAVYATNGPPDYTLLLKGRGDTPIPVAAEAKNNESGRWSLGQLHDHQGRALQRWHDLGGLACILLRHKPAKTCYVLPWSKLGPVWTRWRAGKMSGRRAPSGTASLGDAELAMLGVPWKENEGHYLAMLSAFYGDKVCDVGEDIL